MNAPVGKDGSLLLSQKGFQVLGNKRLLVAVSQHNHDVEWQHIIVIIFAKIVSQLELHSGLQCFAFCRALVNHTLSRCAPCRHQAA